jgi:hypothetical protein
MHRDTNEENWTEHDYLFVAIIYFNFYKYK